MWVGVNSLQSYMKRKFTGSHNLYKWKIQGSESHCTHKKRLNGCGALLNNSKTWNIWALPTFRLSSIQGLFRAVYGHWFFFMDQMLSNYQNDTDL